MLFGSNEVYDMLVLDDIKEREEKRKKERGNSYLYDKRESDSKNEDED